MPVIDSYKPGVFCWLECLTTDQAAGKEFYASLFPWEVEDIGDGAYTNFKKNGEAVAALYALDDDMRAQGIPPHWRLFVAVADVDAAAEKAKAAGGTVLIEPEDVFDAGRMTLIQDPGGAPLALWQAKQFIGASVVNEHGAFSWTELMAHDLKATADFYTATLGWTSETSDVGGTSYTVFANDGRSQAGMMEIAAEWGPMPQVWIPYLSVDDPDETVEKVKGLGGAVNAGPMDIPDVGRFASLQDPQGAAFSIIKPSVVAPPF